jgi:hypothetical protein
VPKFGEGTSSAVEVEQAAPVVRSAEGSIVVLKVPIVGSAETNDDMAIEPELEKTVMLPEILSPPAEAELPKVTKAPATTPKRRRMASAARRCYGNHKDIDSCPCEESCRSCYGPG